ncbi:MAG TPA: CvpA family protein [Rhizomicrobium sp.]|jgi:membrane protein required for colicin V production|nr:CvpA family protein [Rhizomicrobium sp.]HEX4532865.1 CvpA family protein [Rhizomicrobium sp.]
MQGFTFIDLLVVVIVIVSVILAVTRGFVRETLSILAWAAAAFATLYFGPAVAPLTRARISPLWLGDLAGYAAVFLIVLIPLSFISYRISQTVRDSPVGVVDRTLGVAFGFIRGLAVVGILYLAFSLFVEPKSQPAWLVQARLMPLIQSSSEVLLTLVPQQNTRFANDFHRPAASAPVPKPNPHNSAKNSTHRRGQKGYSARDRGELNHLFEATGNGGNGKP